MPELAPKVFNQIEVVLWAVAALIFVLRGVSDAACRRHAFIAATAFLFFSGSDAMEIQTGAWWRPWWLFVWKAACVLTLIGVWWTWPGRAKTDLQDTSDDTA